MSCTLLSQPSQSLKHLQTLNLPRRYLNPDFDLICKWHQSKKLQSGLEGWNDNSSTPSLSWPWRSVIACFEVRRELTGWETLQQLLTGFDSSRLEDWRRGAWQQLVHFFIQNTSMYHGREALMIGLLTYHPFEWQCNHQAAVMTKINELWAIYI